MGQECIPGACFKKWNYPWSLVVFSKHLVFFTAPHKGPFDIFLMESASKHLAACTPLFLHHTALSTNTQAAFKQPNSSAEPPVPNEPSK